MQAASRLAVILGESSTQGQELMADSLRLSTQPFASASATGGSGPAQTAVLSDSLRPRYPRLDPAFEQWPAGGFVQGMLNVVSVEQAPAVEEEPEAPPADAMAPPADDGRLELLHKVRTGDPTWHSHLQAMSLSATGAMLPGVRCKAGGPQTVGSESFGCAPCRRGWHGGSLARSHRTASASSARRAAVTLLGS